VLVVAALTALGLAHAAWVAGRYHVGSFDDDAAYLYMARGIVHGTGLFGRLPNGAPLAGAYPPGYSYLLAPLVWVGGTAGGFWPERLLSAACFAALFPLTWRFVSRRAGPAVAGATLALLALNPLLAGYATMVMAEMPFLVVFLALLFAADRWAASDRTLGAWGGATVVLAGAEVWLKEAGVAMVAGLVLWLCWRRDWRKTTLAVVALAAVLAPIAAARFVSGTPLAGARYAGELGGYYHGGVLHDLWLIPYGIGKYLFAALSQGVVPTGSPVSDHLVTLVVVRGLAVASVPVFCAAGAWDWWRRREGDAALFMVAAYSLECAAYEYINERRIILFLPLAVTWYVLGARRVGRSLIGRGRLSPAAWKRVFAGAACLAVAVPLASQLPDYYKFRVGQDTSHPRGSPYLALLRRLGGRRQVVEASYIWTTALYTGHPSASSAFLATAGGCSPGAAWAAMGHDRAGFLYTAAIDLPPAVDSPCLTRLASQSPRAVTLLHTRVDSATVFALIGPGTGHPAWHDLASAATRRGGDPDSTSTTFRWSLPPGAAVSEVTLGGASTSGGATAGVTVSLLEPGRGWQAVARSRGGVGDGGTPFLAATPAAVPAAGVRVTVTGPGLATIRDLAVLGRGSV
jgi:hypothetical protein